MSLEAQISIITCYHFDSSRVEDYARLIRSLRVSIGELGGGGRLILVANGTEEGAEDPARVIRDLDPSSSAKVDQVVLRRNVGNVGSLNAGIVHALAFPLESGTEWIGSVESSVTLRRSWLKHAVSSMNDPSVGAIFGRLLFEDDRQTIFNDGHYLKEGKTYDKNWGEEKSESKLSRPNKFNGRSCFPCLSAAIFRKTLVKAIVEKYGDFVCENLAHYGNCTDVALRAKAVDPKAEFRYCDKVEAFKRRPILNQLMVRCSQLMAAGLYYDKNRRRKAEERLKTEKLSKELFVDALRDADRRLRRPYSPIGAQPPKASAAFDHEWGE